MNYVFMVWLFHLINCYFTEKNLIHLIFRNLEIKIAKPNLFFYEKKNSNFISIRKTICHHYTYDDCLACLKDNIQLSIQFFVWWNHRSLWFTIESFSPIMEITKIYQLQIFSCLFIFYSSLSRICWKNKCYKKQVPSKIFTLIRCLEINSYVNFHN